MVSTPNGSGNKTKLRKEERSSGLEANRVKSKKDKPTNTNTSKNSGNSKSDKENEVTPKEPLRN